MKKLFIMMLLCAISICVSAQEHLTFKGIPIEGNLTTFVEKLKANGFKLTEMDGDGAIMEGYFSGDTRTILIYASKISKKVYQVIAILEKSNSWSTLKSTYDEFKSSLTTKYGNGVSYEYFSSPYEAGDGYEMSALRLDKCTYATSFNILCGKIRLMISSVGGGSVVVAYTDKVNEELSEKEEKSLISSDL
jgi:hypothetical protein